MPIRACEVTYGVRYDHARARHVSVVTHVINSSERCCPRLCVYDDEQFNMCRDDDIQY